MDEPNSYDDQTEFVVPDTIPDGLENILDSEIDVQLDDLTNQLIAERDEYLKALQLTKADFDNFRRRTSRLEAEVSEQKLLKLIEKLLPSLDDLNSLLNHMVGTEDETLVSKTVPPLFTTLEAEGLALIDEVNVAFDPQLHQAVSHEPGDEPAIVTEIFRLGYSWKGKTLRPAMVKVVG